MVDQVDELLTRALSQTGPDRLPYDESQKWTIRQHVSDLLQVNETSACMNIVRNKIRPPPGARQ